MREDEGKHEIIAPGIGYNNFVAVERAATQARREVAPLALRGIEEGGPLTTFCISALPFREFRTREDAPTPFSTTCK